MLFFLNRGDKGTGGLWFAGITVPAVFWLKWRKPAECKHSGEKWQSNYSVWSWLKGWDQIFSGGCKSIASLNNGWLMGNFFERGPQISFCLARPNEWRRKILTLVWFRMICFGFFSPLFCGIEAVKMLHQQNPWQVYICALMKPCLLKQYVNAVLQNTAQSVYGCKKVHNASRQFNFLSDSSQHLDTEWLKLLLQCQLTLSLFAF